MDGVARRCREGTALAGMNGKRPRDPAGIDRTAHGVSQLVSSVRLAGDEGLVETVIDSYPQLLKARC